LLSVTELKEYILLPSVIKGKISSSRNPGVIREEEAGDAPWE
jgi:hypothetical protein